MCARVPDAVDDAGRELNAVTEIAAGRVVDRVDGHRPAADLRAHRIDERLTDPADARGLGSASREHHLDVGARLSRRGRGCCA